MRRGFKEAITLMATNLPPDKIMCLKSMHEGAGGH